jgi:hypothetical protein
MQYTKEASAAVNKKTPDGGLPIEKWIVNALRGVPNSEDLRRAYFWEARREGSRGAATQESIKRSRRLRRLWRVQWNGTVRMLPGKYNAGQPVDFRSVFLVLQGHQVMWWRTVVEFDNGGTPQGRLYLAGHAGLSSPSPLELKAIDEKDTSSVLCIFGNGARITVVMKSQTEKQQLEEAIETALSSKAE